MKMIAALSCKKSISWQTQNLHKSILRAINKLKISRWGFFNQAGIVRRGICCSYLIVA